MTNTKISITVNLSPEIRLEQALQEAGVENPASVGKLTVSGTFAEADFSYMHKKMRRSLQELDMSKATLENNEIPNYAFERYKSLKLFTIPDTITIIDEFALGGFAAFTTVFIPASVVEIKRAVFAECNALTSIVAHPDNPVYASENGILFSKDKSILVAYPAGLQGDYTVPDTVVEIAEAAFISCRGLTAVTLPDTVTKIGKLAFSECEGLISINIPASVKEIEDYTFDSCSALKSVNIHDTVTKIGEHAFYFCRALTSLHIPASVVNIGEHAFLSCNLANFKVHPDNPVYTVVGTEIEYKCALEKKRLKELKENQKYQKLNYTFKDLIERFEFKDIAPKIVEQDEKAAGSLAGYKQAFDILRHLEPDTEPPPPEKMTIHKSYSIMSKKYCPRVSGYGWQTELTNEILVEKGYTLTDVEIAAAILWELTFFGNPYRSSTACAKA